MSKGNKTLLVIAALVVLVVGGYKWRYPTYSWHQKLTVEIETPDGMKSGSSVVAVSWSQVPQFLPDVNPFSNEITGEATVVDLGNGKYLFALLKGASTLAQRTVVSRSAGPAANAWFYHASKVRSHLGKPVSIKSKHIPILVTFTDINDPKTVKRVDPNNLVASFGTGFALESVMLEITDEPKDVLTGWTSLVGVIPDQALLAAQFYQSVKAANPGKTITLTGHSLGGALAGFVGSLYGEKAVLFNKFSFELVSNEAFTRASITDAEIEALFSDPVLQQVVRDVRTQAISDFYPNGVPESIDRSAIKTLELLGSAANDNSPAEWGIAA